MKPGDVQRAAAVEALVNRASTAAAMPIALHRLGGGGEQTVTGGLPAREACSWLHDQPDGRDACAASRASAVQDALRRGKPTPFVCHMGFACVAVPVQTDNGPAAITAGPFIPAEAPHSIECDVAQALRRLDLLEEGPLPFALADIAVSPVSAAHACAEWLADGLADVWAKEDEPPAPVDDDTPLAALPGRGPAASTRTGKAAALCTAAMAGDWDAVRAGLTAALGSAGSGTPTPVQRARALALAAGALEAAEAVRASAAADCWARLEALAAAARTADTMRALIQAATDFLKPLKKAARPSAGKDRMLAALHEAVSHDLAHSVSLEQIARDLGVHPTAVTHRLQRTLGLSYTEYVGRLRVEKAKGLLGRTKLGVGEIGRRVGIDDVSNFAKLFRRHEGVSPGTYRARRGKKA